MKILIADDDATYRAMLEAVFRLEEGVNIVGVASQAEEAVELATEHCPEVAFVDVMMPGGGGARAVEGIRAACPLTRIIALSGSKDRTQVIAMLRSGADGYLTKTSSPAEIIDAARASVPGFVTLSKVAATEILTTEQALPARHLDTIRAVIDGRDGAEILLQPIVRLPDATTIGHEALARFDSDPPEGPDVWIQRAERAGLGTELEVALLRRALATIATIPADSYLTVNLSPAALLSGDAAEILARHPESSRIVVEITEQEPIADYLVMRRALNDLRTAGVRVAIDDVGAGFASLRHILELTPAFVKIDRSIIHHIDVDSPRRAVARALVGFTAELDCFAVAEGVETQAELDVIQDLGVGLAQGYHFGHPARIREPRWVDMADRLLAPCVDAVARASSASDGVAGLARALQSHIPVIRASVRVLQPDGTVKIVALWTAEETLLPLGSVTRAVATSFPEIARRNGPVTSAESGAQALAIAEVIQQEGARSWASFPLHDERGGVAGILSFSSSDPRSFTGEELNVLQRVLVEIDRPLMQRRRPA